MDRIFVPLDNQQRAALIRYALTEYRDPRIQAALFIQQGLEKVGALPAAEPQPEQAQLSQGVAHAASNN